MSYFGYFHCVVWAQKAVMWPNKEGHHIAAHILEEHMWCLWKTMNDWSTAKITSDRKALYTTPVKLNQKIVRTESVRTANGLIGWEHPEQLKGCRGQRGAKPLVSPHAQVWPLLFSGIAEHPCLRGGRVILGPLLSIPPEGAETIQRGVEGCQDCLRWLYGSAN